MAHGTAIGEASRLQAPANTIAKAWQKASCSAKSHGSVKAPKRAHSQPLGLHRSCQRSSIASERAGVKASASGNSVVLMFLTK